jgi:hypothetical protein
MKEKEKKVNSVIEPEFNESELSRIRQGVEWVKGNSEHNPITDECVPDGSCCDHDRQVLHRELRIEYFVKKCIRYEQSLSRYECTIASKNENVEQIKSDILNYVDALKTLIEVKTNQI